MDMKNVLGSEGIVAKTMQVNDWGTQVQLFLTLLTIAMTTWLMCKYLCNRQPAMRAQHNAVRAIMNWQKIFKHVVKVRWFQLAFWLYGNRLQQLNQSFRYRLTTYVRPTP